MCEESPFIVFYHHTKMCPQFLLYTEKQMATEYTNLYSILYTISLFYQLGLISNLIAKLQSNRDKLLMQVLERPTSVGTQLDLLYRNQEELAGDMTLSGSLGCSDHKQRWLTA